jgi:ABC-type proline/glycine betaine transport system permease subunit
MKPKHKESIWSHLTHYASSEISLYVVMIVGIVIGIIIFS